MRALERSATREIAVGLPVHACAVDLGSSLVAGEHSEWNMSRVGGNYRRTISGSVHGGVLGTRRSDFEKCKSSQPEQNDQEGCGAVDQNPLATVLRCGVTGYI